MPKLRADQLLVKRGLAPSRTKAQEIIESGEAEFQAGGEWRFIDQASQRLPINCDVRLLSCETLKFVSRGGRKLEGALVEFAIDPSGWVCLDVGQSTGGFTDCLLQRGARQIVGLDVGIDQLHPALLNDSRVVSFVKFDVREMATSQQLEKVRPSGGFDLVVVDLSFISAVSVLSELLQQGKRLLLLLKPQYEVGQDKRLRKKDMVIIDGMVQNLRERIANELSVMRWSLEGFAESRIRGKDGTQEYFVYAKLKS